MKSKVLGALMFSLAMAGPVMASQPYVQGSLGGVFGSIEGGSAGFRVGAVKYALDASVGYDRISGNLYSDKVQSDSIDLHVLSAEVYRIFKVSALDFKLGGGIAFMSPQMSSIEKADDDAGFIAGGSVDYKISRNVSLGLKVRGNFFNTDVHRTDFLIEKETLSAGQEVETVTPVYKTDSVNLNNISSIFSLTLWF